MASIERTAYPRFPRTLTLKDLQASFTPKPEEIEWAQQHARTADRRLAILVLLKCFEFLRHFPALVGWLPAHTPHLAEVEPPAQPALETQDRIQTEDAGGKT